jgi:hypothetical protein
MPLRLRLASTVILPLVGGRVLRVASVLVECSPDQGSDRAQD